jgi:hypothetical protein
MKIHNFLHKSCYDICVMSDQFDFLALFMIFNLWIDKGLILRAYSYFLISQ